MAPRHQDVGSPRRSEPAALGRCDAKGCEDRHRERAALIHAAKHFLWSMRVDPPAGRKRSSLASLHMKGLILRTLIGWMAIEGLRRFSDIDPSAVDRLCVWLRGRPARNGKARVSPSTVSNYLLAIKDLYRQRTKLSDAPRVDPLPLDTTFEAAGVTRQSIARRSG
jgi:hypothetical protein